MHRSIAEEPEVGCQQILVVLQQAFYVRAAGFLFTFEEKLEVGFRRDASSFQGVNRGEHGDDYTFIVAGGSRVYAIAGDFIVNQARLKRIAAGPFRRLDGLAVVMRIKNDRLFRPWGVDFSKYNWRYARLFEQPRLDSSLLELSKDPCRI